MEELQQKFGQMICKKCEKKFYSCILYCLVLLFLFTVLSSQIDLANTKNVLITKISFSASDFFLLKKQQPKEQKNGLDSKRV